MRSWSRPFIPEVSLPIPPLRLWDSARQCLQPLAAGNEVSMYVCGITPYDATHLGHGATYLVFDIINRILRLQGKKINYIQNNTDVDDPLFERAQRDGVSWIDLGEKETELFRQDMRQLSVIPPEHYIGAVETIPDIGQAVQELLDQGIAYQITSDQYPDVYFPISQSENFGYISHYTREMMQEIFSQRGGDPHRVGKKDPLDALLWKAARPGEPYWDSPIGKGRPGWHIECAIIAMKYASIPIDIQGGGCDLLFPHHEFSAAHAQSLSGQPRFARHYVHTGMIGFQGEKMSKSKGNLVFVSQLLASGIDPNIIRIGLFDRHYSLDRNWDDAVLNAARHRLDLWNAAIELDRTVDPHPMLATVATFLADNLQTPQAFAAIDHWARQSLSHAGNDPNGGKKVADSLDALLGMKFTHIPRISNTAIS